MHTWFRRLRRAFRTRPAQRQAPVLLMLEGLEDRCLLDAGIGFVQTNLVSDLRGVAAHTDRDLINPWGFAETPQGQFRVSANGAGNSPLFNAEGDSVGKAILIPPPLGSAPGTTATPNGAVFNTTSDFVITDNGRSAPASVIYSTEDGTIAAFNPAVDRNQAVLAADQSSTGAVYKLLAMGSNSQGNFLFATDFHNDKIDVFDKNFHKVALGANGFGTFTDPNATPGFAPFGIKNVNGTLFVTFAKQQAPDNHDDEAGPGNGFIDEFDTSGNFLGRFASGTAAGGTLTQLNSPIGMAVAPAGFGPGGKFGGALLVGNFGDSHVSAFDLKTGAFLGQLSDAQGNPLTLNGGVGGSGTKGLWGIGFGNGQGGTNPNTLYFAAGINDENDGLFGEVTMTDGEHDHDDRGGDHEDHASTGHDAVAAAVSTTQAEATTTGRGQGDGGSAAAQVQALLALTHTGTSVLGLGSLGGGSTASSTHTADDVVFSQLGQDLLALAHGTRIGSDAGSLTASIASQDAGDTPSDPLALDQGG